jgi:5S rRNA maturation endonuclease (ribonuclease M5)
MDDELERFKRTVNLTELAASLGYQLEPRDRGARASVSMRHPARDDKIVIRRDSDGHWTYFSVRDDHDNGSVVDFLQRRRHISLGAVRKELRAWLREDRPRPPPELYRPTIEVSTRNEAAVSAVYAAASLRESPYLVGRGIQPETLRARRFARSYRIDARGNVLFPHVDPTREERVVGYEVKNHGFSGFARGGRKTFWVSSVRPDDARLVIVEGVIDAYSYHQLFSTPRARYLSTGGAVGPEQLALIGQAIAAMPKDAEIVIATDADAGGEKLHKQIGDVAANARLRRHASPVPKDWNDYLRVTLERARPLRRESRLER